MLNNAELELKIHSAMYDLDLNEATILLQNIDTNAIEIDHDYMNEIKDQTMKMLGLEVTETTRYASNKEVNRKVDSKTRKGFIRWIRYTAAVAAVILCFAAIINSDSIVFAVQNMISLIPGIGIVEDNQTFQYRIKEPVEAKNDQCSLKILYGTTTKDTITIRFNLEGIFTEEQRQKTKDSKDMLNKLNIYLLVDNQKFDKYNGGSGSGISEYTYNYNCNYTFEVDPKYINSKEKFTLVCEDNKISVDFRLCKIDEYSTTSEIGTTQTHNDISLTTDSSLKDGVLSIYVYPINESKYNLISFNQEYDVEYFKKKMTLSTDKGIKNYTPPSYYGTDLNAAFTFDVSDGSSDFVLSIPFVVVEAEEIKEVSLPIPEEGEIAEVNHEVTFEYGSAIIKSVERLAGDVGNQYGYLKINLDYISLDENQQLVGVEFSGAQRLGWYTKKDDQNRVIAIEYMLNESDAKELKLEVIKPRYILMTPYSMDINIK